MLRYFAAYLATAAVLIAIDLVWLGIIAKPLYQQGIGHLLSERPNIPVAIIFYALFALGLLIFAVAPNDSPDRWGKALLSAALFGFFAYATYDLTNLATLKGWPIGLSLIDMAWGTVVSVAATAAGKAALGWVNG